MQADPSAHPLIEHIGHDCVESPERQRSIKKVCSKVRSSSVPVHTKEKYQKTVSTPLIKDMFSQAIHQTSTCNVSYTESRGSCFYR